MCSTRCSTLQLLYSCCLYVTTPLHDINLHPTNADSHSLTVSCLLVQYGMIIKVCHLPFFGLSQNRSPRGSPLSRLLRSDISYKGLQQTTTPSYCTHCPVKTTLLFLLFTPVRPKAHPVEQHARWV